MSFCVVAGKDMTSENGYRRYGEFFAKYKYQETPSPLYILENEKYLILTVGDYFDIDDIDNLLLDSWEINPSKLTDVSSAFSIVKIDKVEGNVYFATSKSGIENMYYYYKDEVFIITDDFWEAVNVIDPSFNDIDRQYLHETIINIYPLFEGTIIKNLYWVLPAKCGSYLCRSKHLIMQRYWDFYYQPIKDRSFDDAVEDMDRILNETMQKIKQKCGNVQYSIGLSGGMDSRIIPYYAIKNGLMLNSFIIGEKRPLKILLSRDHKSARQLAKFYNLEHKEIEYNYDTFETRIKNSVMHNPLGGSQVFKLVINGLPKFEVLLNGGNGAIVGATLPEDILGMNEDAMIDYITRSFDNINEISLFQDRISRALKYLFNINYQPKPKSITWLKKIVPPEIRENMKTKLRNFITERKGLGRSNLDIYGEYSTHFLGCRNRRGAFESICGHKRSFSIWSPFFVNEAMSWDVNYMLDRALLKELIRRKIPGIADIKTQSYETSIAKENVGKLQRIWALGIYLLRGAGTMGYNRWVKKREFKNEFKKIMNKNTLWFYQLIPIKNELDEICKTQYRLAEALIKVKCVLDAIETKDYKNFI